MSSSNPDSASSPREPSLSEHEIAQFWEDGFLVLDDVFDAGEIEELRTNTDLVAVMVMLDDATPANGCMRMVRGSHKRGLLDHMDEDESFTGMCREPNAWNDHGDDIVDITPLAGGMSMHHCLMLHGAGPNRSGSPRRGLGFQYRADDAFQMADGVWSDTGLVVSGVRHERACCDAGVLRLPRSTGYPGHPFGHAWNQEGELARELNEHDRPRG